MPQLYTAILLFLLAWRPCAEYLPPLKEVLDNTEFRQALISLGQCRSHLYVCAYRLAQCVERARGPSDPASEDVLKETVQRWGDAKDDDLCQKSLTECKEQYFACDATAPDPGKLVEAINKKHADLANREPHTKLKHQPVTDGNSDPVRDLLGRGDADPAWDFDMKMPYRARKVEPETDPRLMAWQGTGRMWKRRPAIWDTYLANSLPIMVISLAVVLVRRSLQNFKLRLPRRLVKFACLQTTTRK